VSGIGYWLLGSLFLIALGALGSWLIRSSRSATREPVNDLSVERSRSYPVPPAARILAGILAVTLLVLVGVELDSSGDGRSLRSVVEELALAALFLYAAVSGRSPAWLESAEDAGREIKRLVSRWRTHRESDGNV
jgi:hypothetical protein